MAMTWVWTIFAAAAVLFGIINGTGAEVTASALDGAKAAVELTVAIAGPLCLWSGVGKLMERIGLMGLLSGLFAPVLHRLFPKSKDDPELSGALSANLCANLLGLGNAATPMGIKAVRRLQDPVHPDTATDQMCRLVVMNTASIQLLPTTVAAVRRGAGAVSAFDILPCVWAASLFSVVAGMTAAYLFAKALRHE